MHNAASARTLPSPRGRYRRGARAWAAVIAVALSASWFVGCVTKPNEESGPDAYRHQAEEIELEKWIPDSVSAFDGDLTDWKSFTLPNPGDVIVTVVFADDFTAGEVAVYDKYGMPIASGVKEEPDAARVVLKGAAPAGKNFLRVTSGPKHKAEYTVQVLMASRRFAVPE